MDYTKYSKPVVASTKPQIGSTKPQIASTKPQVPAGTAFKVPPPKYSKKYRLVIKPKYIKPLKFKNQKNQLTYIRDTVRRVERLLELIEKKQPYILNNRFLLLAEYVKLRRRKDRLTEKEFLRSPALLWRSRELILQLLDDFTELRNKADKYIIRVHA